MAHALPYLCSVHVTASRWTADLPSVPLLRLCAALHSAPALSTYVPTVLSCCSAGIFTCCPSATPSGLALGPDLPRADQLYPGNLGYSAWRIPTSISLLIPAFSLPSGPQALTGPASLLMECSSTMPFLLKAHPRLRRCVSAPDIFGAGPLG